MAKAYKTQENKSIIPQKYLTAFYIVALVVSVYVFLAPGIFGEGFSAADTIASESFETYLNDANDKGEFPLWIPYIFSGMPSYPALLVTGERLWDFAPQIIFGVGEIIGQIFGNDTARIAFYYALYAIGMFFLMRMKKHSHFVAFFTAFAATFSTAVIIWIMIGHNTKPVVFMLFPWIFLFLERLRVKFSLLYAVLLAFAVHLMFEGAHVQMIFYGFAAFGIYLLFELISRAAQKDKPIGVLRAAAVLAVAGGLAFLMSSDRYLAVQEYTPYSTRGSSPLVEESSAKQSDQKDYEYATMWSFSPQEVITFFVPNYYGFGRMDVSEISGSSQPDKQIVYWGQKPFDDAAPYMGIIVLIFGIFGAIMYRKDAFVQFLIVISFFSLFLSFGHNLPLLFDIFYYYFPNFSKFRAPSMALALIQFAMPILAGYGLTGMLKWRSEQGKANQKLMKSLLVTAGAFLVLGVLFAFAFETSYISAMTNSPNGSRFPANLQTFLFDATKADWFTGAFILIAAVGLVYFYAKSKVSQTVLFGGLALLLVIDMWRVAYRPMEEAGSSNQAAIFRSDDVIQFLKQDKDVYRIADFVSPSPNVPAYFKLQNVGGYHSAKLRVYQDLLDNADQGSTSQVTNPFLWSLLNVKYLIAGQQLQGLQPAYQSQSGKIVYYSPNYLPRVFFVDSVAVEKNTEILKKLKDGTFNPYRVAYLEESLGSEIEATTEDATAEVVKYENHYIEIKAKATGNNLLFISEIYYPAGWTAYIDGKEVPIHKTNFAFRSVIVPAGEHKIEMKFRSEGFETGKTLSLATNIAMGLLLLVGLFFEFRKRKNINNENEKE